MASNKGEACEIDEQCSTGTCRDHICVIPDRGYDHCSSKYGCEGGLVCVAVKGFSYRFQNTDKGRFETTTGRPILRCEKSDVEKTEEYTGLCDKAIECRQHEYCDKEDESKGTCRERRKVGEVCDENRDIFLGGNECESGIPCFAGKCRTSCSFGNPTTCKDDEVCLKMIAGYGFCINDDEMDSIMPADPKAAASASSMMLGPYGAGAGLALLFIVLLLIYILRRR